MQKRSAILNNESSMMSDNMGKEYKLPSPKPIPGTFVSKMSNGNMNNVQHNLENFFNH